MAETLELVDSFRRLVPLAGAGDRAAASDLLGALIDSDHGRQASASRALHAVSSERFWRLAVEFLATSRWQGARLTRPLTQVWRQKLRQHLYVLITLRHDPAADVARDGALISALCDQSPYVRACAADLLGERRAPDSVDALIRVLDDSSPAVRIHAARGLGRLEQAEAVQPLIRALRHRNDALAGAAVDTLV